METPLVDNVQIINTNEPYFIKEDGVDYIVHRGTRRPIPSRVLYSEYGK